MLVRGLTRSALCATYGPATATTATATATTAANSLASSLVVAPVSLGGGGARTLSSAALCEIACMQRRTLSVSVAHLPVCAAASPTTTATRYLSTHSNAVLSEGDDSGRPVASDRKRVKKGKNLIELLGTRPNMGVGLRVRRKLWWYPEPTFVTVTRVAPRPDGRGGKAWGVVTWRGETAEKSTKIRGTLKREWEVYREWTDEELAAAQARAAEAKEAAAAAAEGRTPNYADV